MVLEHIRSINKKASSNLSLTQYANVELTLIVNLNVAHNAVKLLEEKLG